ncbi:maleate cis-trans isomerase family protein [Alteribacillus iranensis]|uniref:Maleate cis-trans isomerase n=1 Tax=Alteribacillus iranensis TaxID=930128 RepID=A0A1I2D3D4_9BACI|nr:maleate cis-trans isomerase [Alteribacillus iranensis]SFE75021.1 Maleate cis-trans isomerase [Alteribacillus iranensis]
MSGKKRIAFLYPGYAAEDDYPRMGQLVNPQVDVEVIHTSFEKDAHTVEALSEMGSLPRLLEGAQHLKNKDIDAVLWTSTSASFVLGREGVEQQIEALEKELNVPASTTALAFARAARTLDIKRAAVAAPYPEDIASLFTQFLGAFDIDILDCEAKGIITAAEVGTLTKNEILQFAADSDHPQAEALLIPDTALHTAEWIEALEETVGKPVLTANQVSFWETLRIAGLLEEQYGMGTLFKQGITNGNVELT